MNALWLTADAKPEPELELNLDRARGSTSQTLQPFTTPCANTLIRDWAQFTEPLPIHSSQQRTTRIHHGLAKRQSQAPVLW